VFVAVMIILFICLMMIMIRLVFFSLAERSQCREDQVGVFIVVFIP